jgi:hypothetical protein
MPSKVTQKANYDFDTTTYVLVGFILLTVLVGGIKILFF